MNSPTIQESFEQFHKDNPQVYRKLVELARQAKAAGHYAYSIDSLMHVVRWETSIVQRGSRDFKLNDHFSSRYARLIMENEQDLAGFFRVRELRAA